MLIEPTIPRKSISDIYYLANTPSYLYDMMRQDSYVMFMSNRSSQELINEFKLLADTSLETLHDMAYMYAILIALTFKPLNEVNEFMCSVREKISFEWFPAIVNLFYNKQSIQTITDVAMSNPLINTFSY